MGNDVKVPDNISEGISDKVNFRYFSENDAIRFPSNLQELLKFCALPVQKDILILTLLTAYSALLGTTYFYYRSNQFSANLFFMVVGESGSYKGYAEHARKLLKDVFAKYARLNALIKEEFRKAEHRWKQEVKKAGKEGREVDYSLMPDKAPRYIDFLCADRTSASQLINNFYYTQDIGMIMIDSELGSMVSTLGTECGQFGAEIRKAAMNEPISQHFLSGGEPIMIPFPRLSFIVASTPDVMVDFLKDTDDGSLPRYLYILTEDTLTFDEWDEDDLGMKLAKAVEALAPMALDMHEFYLKHPFEMKTTANQKKRLSRMFQGIMDGISFENMKGYSSVVKRTPIMLLRICCVLTAIRKYQMNNTDAEFICTDEDFNTAMELIRINIQHTFMVITMLPVNKKKLKAEKPRCPYLFMDVMRSLPDEFDAKDFVLQAEAKYSIPKKRSYHSLFRQTERGYLLDLGYGRYQKTQKLKDYMNELRNRYFG